MNKFLAGLDYKNIFLQGSRYLIVGFCSAGIELALFFGLYELLGVYVVASNVAAISCATLFNFVLSYKWTFKAVTSLPKSITLYLLLFVFNQLFSSLMIVWLITLELPALAAKIVTMACIVCWNFVLYRKLVFK